MNALLPPITSAARRGIDVLEALRGALSALSANLLRSILTALGIFIGVAAVIATVAVGEGARRQVLAQIQSLGANLLIVFIEYVTNFFISTVNAFGFSIIKSRLICVSFNEALTISKRAIFLHLSA